MRTRDLLNSKLVGDNILKWFHEMGGALTHMGDMSNAYRILDGKREGRVILKWILKKCGVRVWIGFMWLRIGTGGGLL
jgi:hypothetical protein